MASSSRMGGPIPTTTTSSAHQPPPSAAAAVVFDVHAGRNAFRRQKSERASEMTRDLESMSVEELRRQQFVIRSFTESVDGDDQWPTASPADEDIGGRGGEEDGDEEEEEEEGMGREGGGGGGGMKESSTAETIIEVASRVDPTKGETQKYTMRVPGPELVDQEFELHKSLIKGAGEMMEAEGDISGLGGGAPQSTAFTAPSSSSALWPSADEEEEEEEEEGGQRRRGPSQMRHHPAVPPPDIARPRPTTPTGLSFSRLESFSAEMATSSSSSSQMPSSADRRMPPDSLPSKMRVIIPKTKLKDGQRRFSTGAREWGGGERAPMTRTRCGSTAVCPWGAEDIIEANPEYARKAPRKPVVHRRQSREWESFDDGEGGREEEEAKENDVGELAKQLQEEVHRLIEEAEQKLQQQQVEEEPSPGPSSSRPMSNQTGIPAASPPPTPTSTPVASHFSHVASPATCHSQMDDTHFQTPAHFTSPSSPQPVRAAPPPPPPMTRNAGTEEGRMEVEHAQVGEHPHDEAEGAGGDQRRLELFESVVETRMTATLEYPAAPAGPSAANPFGGGWEEDGQERKYGHEQQYGQGGEYGGGGNMAMASYGNVAGEGWGQDMPSSYDQGYGQGYAQQGGEYAGQYGGVGYGGSAVANPYGGQSPYAGTEQQYGQGQYGQEEGDGGYGAGTTTMAPPDQYGHYDQYGGGQYGGAGNPFDGGGYAAGGMGTEYPQQPEYGQEYGHAGVQPEYGQEYGGQTDYSQYGQPVVPTAPFVDTSLYGSSPSRPPPVPPPPPSIALAPLLPQRARTPDPYSWEAQESAAISEQGAAAAPPARPPPMRTAAKTPEEEREDGKEEKDGMAPPRPKAPPPSRPPAPSPSRPPAPPSPRPARKTPEQEAGKGEEEKEAADEEDPWARFKKMTEQVSEAVKSTEKRLGQLGEESAAGQLQDDQLVHNYLAHAGPQGMQLSATQRQQLAQQEAERKRAKAEKKMRKLEKGLGGLGAAIGGVVGAGKKAGQKREAEMADPKREMDLEKASAELARKIAAQHGFRLEGQEEEGGKREEEGNEENKKEAEEDEEMDGEDEMMPKEAEPGEKPTVEIAAEIEEPARSWAPFDAAPLMPPSESEMELAEKLCSTTIDPFDTSKANAALEGDTTELDPFAPVSHPQEDVDPFEVKPVEEIIAEARQQAELEVRRRAAEHEGEFVAEERMMDRLSVSRLSTPTPEGGSPVTPSMAAAIRPPGFEDDFKAQMPDSDTPLFDEDDSQPLPEFPAQFRGDGWELMMRYPPKKKLMADRYWKPIYVRLQGNMLALYANNHETRPSQEILLQASYSLSDTMLQAYDIYGKIHTVKLQHVLYKERVGIRPGQISRLVEGHITKYGLPLEHAAQCTVLAKFASLDAQLMASFTQAVEDVLFKCPAKRETAPIYRQDEVQIHCYDEYEARVDRDGFVHDQKARVRLFCLSFLSGSPFLEIGLNDRRREGKEVVRRKDILPMYTERWIRFEGMEFHETVQKEVWEEDQVVRLQPPDGCFFEIMRFRVRPPRNREKPLNVKCVMRMAGSKVEIRIDAMAAIHQQRAKGTAESTRQIPCEDIQIRFPLPEAWIYIFREERHWGVGSVHSKSRKPGRVKNLKDKLMGTVQQHEPCLIEVGMGEAKYEHLYRSLVWRIPRLPDKQSAAYKSYMLKCRFELSSFDLMPETFVPQCQVEFTMPLAIISSTVIRSIGVEQHEDSERVEKFVRYVAKCHYSIEIDYVQCPDLDAPEMVDAAEVPAEPAQHVAAFNPEEVQNRHEGYRIELPEDNLRRPEEANGSGEGGERRRASSSSSSDEDAGRRAFPVIQIDMKGYGY